MDIHLPENWCKDCANLTDFAEATMSLVVDENIKQDGHCLKAAFTEAAVNYIPQTGGQIKSARAVVEL